MIKLSILASLAVAFATPAVADDKTPACVVTDINGQGADLTINLNLKTASLGESKCKAQAIPFVSKELKANAKWCGKQNGGKVPFTVAWGTKTKRSEHKMEATCPFVVGKK